MGTARRKPKVGGADPFAGDRRDMESGRAPLSRFVPYPNNPRTHPPAEITLLARLVKEYGADQPIVVDEDWVILKGHGRRLAALEAGIEEFPFVRRFGLSEADKVAMRIQDNAVPLLAGWDRTLVHAEITILKGLGYDLPLLGFGEGQIVQFTTVPGPPSEFQRIGEDVPTDFCCPRCRYRWSGNPMAGAKKGAEPPAEAKGARGGKARGNPKANGPEASR